MIPTPLSPVEKSTSKSSWWKVWGQQDHTMVTNFVVPGPGVQEQDGRGPTLHWSLQTLPLTLGAVGPAPVTQSSDE